MFDEPLLGKFALRQHSSRSGKITRLYKGRCDVTMPDGRVFKGVHFAQGFTWPLGAWVTIERVEKDWQVIGNGPAPARVITDEVIPPEPPEPVIVNTTVWLQAAANIRKDWLGFTNLNFSTVDPPIVEEITEDDDWKVLFDLDNMGSVAFLGPYSPNILVVEETYTDLPADDVNKRMVTLVVFRHQINEDHTIDSFLYLYKIKDRLDGTGRGMIESLFDASLATVSLPIQAWHIPYPPEGFTKFALSTVSNAYARTYNNTLTWELDGEDNQTENVGDPYDRVHITFIQPTMLDVVGRAPSYAFNVFEVNLNLFSLQIMTQTSQVPSVRVNSFLKDPEDGVDFGWVWDGFMGSAHVSVAMNVMLQAHIAGEKLIFSWRGKTFEENLSNWMEWHPIHAPAWNALIPELDSDTPKHRTSNMFFDHSTATNNSPAKIKDANIWHRRPVDDPDGQMIYPDTENPEDGWVLPYYSLYGEKFDTNEDNYGGTFRGILWLVFCQMTDARVFTSSAVKVLERTNPTEADTLILSSFDSVVMSNLISYLEDLYNVVYGVMKDNPVYFSYTCPETVECVGYGPFLSGCENPCYGPSQCATPPEASGCFCYNYLNDYNELLLRNNFLLYQWGGFLEIGQSVTDVFGNVYPNPGLAPLNKDRLNNVIIPLPLAYPNLQPNNFNSKCCWTAKSRVTPSNGSKETVDPLVAISDIDGAIYMVIIEAKFVSVPTGEVITILTNNTGGGSFPPPDDAPDPGTILCGWEWTCYDFRSIHTSCESCEEGPFDGEGNGGYFQAGPFVCNNYVILPGDVNTTDTYTEYTSYGTKEIVEARETKLLITNKTGTSTLTVPICASFTGVKLNLPYPAGVVTISESVPCPENYWDIALWKGFLLLIIDARDAFEHSPRPVLQIHDRVTGAKVAEYLGIIPTEVYEDRYPVSESDPLFDEKSLKTRWEMWGKKSWSTTHRPGPRFKLAYQQDKEDVSGDENKPLFIHISADMYEIPAGDEPETIQSRREYRILKFDGSTLTEDSSMSETKDVEGQNVGGVDIGVTFPEKYPGPEDLGSMALTEEEVFLPARQFIGEDFYGWKLISHQVSTA